MRRDRPRIHDQPPPSAVIDKLLGGGAPFSPNPAASTAYTPPATGPLPMPASLLSLAPSRHRTLIEIVNCLQQVNAKAEFPILHEALVREQMHEVGSQKSQFSESPASSAILQRFARLADPYTLKIAGPDGKPILETDLQQNAAEKILQLLEGMTGAARKRILFGVERELKRDRLLRDREIADGVRQVETLDQSTKCMRDFLEWSKANGPVFKLQHPNGSVAHKLRDAIREGRVRSFDSQAVEGVMDAETLARTARYLSIATPFLVQHDWASVMNLDAPDFEGSEFKLPAERCVFEFRVAGRSVISLVYEDDTVVGGKAASLAIQGCDDFWICDPPEAILRPLILLVDRSVRAVSIMLEAQVAETEVIRAPHRLNRAREKLGRAPLADFHVVNLARRTRPAPLPRDPSAEPGTRKRLHFRRGHWRHFETSKTWITWMLVGDPELGWIDKIYRL